MGSEIILWLFGCVAGLVALFFAAGLLANLIAKTGISGKTAEVKS